MSTPTPTPPTDPDQLKPYVEDVARLIRARTKDDQGREVGTFTADTRPTADQVEAHIEAALGLVSTRLPSVIPDRLQPAVRNLVAYRAALQIEKSYFPEQVRSDRSAYTQLRDEYNEDLAALLNAIAEIPGYGAPGKRAGSEFTPTWLHEYAYANLLGWTPAMMTWVEVYGDVGTDYWPEPENPMNWQAAHQPPRQGVPDDLPVGQEPARQANRPVP
jgi:hypothetical protein